MSFKFGLLISILIIVVCGRQNICAFEKQSDGVVFHLSKQKATDPQLIKIQVCTNNIIRIIASPLESFPKVQSLMTDDKNWNPVDWSLSSKGRLIEISTSEIYAEVDTVTGELAFYNKSGKLILHEIAGGGKIVTPSEVMGEKTFNIQQLFDSPADEAFYGLGQHQNGVMNYKGLDVDLWQSNMNVTVPFLVSSKNYGILWDNNSRTKFGDIRDYQSISSLKLFDKDGISGGLTAEYFKDQEFNSLFTSRIENRIEHKYKDVNDNYPNGFLENVKAVRWSGELECNEPGIHKLCLFSSDYIKVWLDGKLMVDSWRQNWLPWTHFLELSMEKGKHYKIKIEWIPDNGYIGLDYLTPSKINFQNAISLYSEVADQIDYYFIYGNSLDSVISGYREITGKAPMMPKWAMGLWQCRQRYKTQDELLSIVKEFRDRKIPLDNIVQDWFYWKEDQWGSHKFDLDRYPDPDGMINKLHDELHAHIMISVWPKFYVGTGHYEEFKQHGWLLMHNVEKKQLDWVGPGYVSTFYDPYSEGARELYWKQINDNLFSKGIDAWWLDATEPDIQSDLSREETIFRNGPTHLGSASRYLNTYSLVNCKAVYEGQKKTDPDKRVFVLTRSAFAGQQRYSAATWSGDIASRWEDLKNQISAGMNFSLSGIPYWTSDIGGFAVEARYQNPDSANLAEWRELMSRWFQFGTFCPLFRVHGEFPYREIFNTAPENHPAYKTMLAYDKLRYRLMPYIYSLTSMVTKNDYTIMRALPMDFNADNKVLNIDDEFMFGPALLINPVTAYKARQRSVYLPSGSGWYELRSGKYFNGGQTIEADAPYSDIPIYAKAGSIITCGPDIQYTNEKAEDTVRLFVYTGSSCSFNLYEDEGTNCNYEKGLFSIIPLQYNEKNQALTIGKRQGQFPGMIKNKTIQIVWVTPGKQSGLDFEKKPDITIQFTGDQQVIKNNL
jgi:alpha-D-xyloside xylohydrolase